MPAVQPAELWQENPAAGTTVRAELLRFKDRHDRLRRRPDHEEVITDVVAP